jgi:pyruvate formate lyase activating enzyme
MKVSRRGLIKLLAIAGMGAATVPSTQAFNIFDMFENEYYPEDLTEAMLYKTLSNGNVQCTLCPREVILQPGKACFCKTRRNVDGKLYAMGYDSPCIVNIEPIEHGPLYHFMPGTKSLSIGAAGCNMDCLYCQNFDLAQSYPEHAKSIDLDIQTMLQNKEIKSITMTYTDAICQPEYLIEVFSMAKRAGLKTVLCTGAFVNTHALKKIIPYVDAFVVTIKASDDTMYRKLTGVSLAPVLEAVKTIHQSGKWLEIVNLIVPGYNDRKVDVETLLNWVKQNLGTKVPLHFSRFTPAYKLNHIQPTSRKAMEQARDLGIQKGLEYVYITNLSPHKYNHTFCHSCGKKVVGRLGFSLSENRLEGSFCPDCGHQIPGVFA